MCNIMYVSKEGYITKEELFAAWRCNPDMGGIAYRQAGVVYNIKGIKTKEELWDLYEKCHKISEVAIHTRIGTGACGNAEPKFSHPMKISTRPTDMYETYFTGNSVMHNGILRKYEGAMEGYSDTQAFVYKFITRIAKVDPAFYKDEYTLKQIEKELEGSKLLLFMEDKTVTLGSWQTLREGVLTSNLYFMSYMWDDKYDSHYGYYDTTYDSDFNNYCYYTYNYNNKKSKKHNKKQWKYNNYYFREADGTLVTFDRWDDYVAYSRAAEKKQQEDLEYEMFWQEQQKYKAQKRAKMFFND